MTGKRRICFISKYPPIEGGVSSLTYWLAEALGARGHQVHVVTNSAEVESLYRQEFGPQEIKKYYQPKNVFLHNTAALSGRLKNRVPGYIPYTNPYAEKLAGLAIETIQKHKLELIDSWYLLPYGVAGFLAKSVTGRPQILRHAGSDLGRLYPHPYLKTIFQSLFRHVDKILTSRLTRDFFLDQKIPAEKLAFYGNFGVEPRAFNPQAPALDPGTLRRLRIEPNIPLITYIGKATQAKGIEQLLAACSGIKQDFRLLLVCNGPYLEQFKKQAQKPPLNKKVIFCSFLGPWKMPALIRSSRCVAVLEHGFEIEQHCPVLPREVMACGKCLLLSRQLYGKSRYPGMQSGQTMLAVDPRNIRLLRQALEKIIQDEDYAQALGAKAALACWDNGVKFEHYLDETLELYERLLRLSK